MNNRQHLLASLARAVVGYPMEGIERITVETVEGVDCVAFCVDDPSDDGVFDVSSDIEGEVISDVYQEFIPPWRLLKIADRRPRPRRERAVVYSRDELEFRPEMLQWWPRGGDDYARDLTWLIILVGTGPRDGVLAAWIGVDGAVYLEPTEWPPPARAYDLKARIENCADFADTFREVHFRVWTGQGVRQLAFASEIHYPVTSLGSTNS